MKKPRLAKKFLEELSKIPIVSIACEKTGLSRQTVYRWREEDLHFRNAFDNALEMGNNSITDLAESKLISNVNNGNQRAIEFLLINNKRKYHRPKLPLQVDTPGYKGIKSFTIIRPTPPKEIT